VRVQTERLTVSHRQVFEGLRAAGIGVNVHYIPVHLQPYYRDLGFAADDFPEACAYYAQAISLPLYPAMTDEQQDCVIGQLKRLLTTAE
jgi:dTDP-4-amino-4,6-dideoxygalactose transaminase